MRHFFAPFPQVTNPFHGLRRLSIGSLLSAIFFVCVLPANASRAATTTTISVTPSGAVTQGTVLALQAVVDASGAVTSGSVTFYDGTTALAAIQLVSTGSAFTLATANLKLRLGPGDHVLKAVYGGTSGYLTSTSATQTITVTQSSLAATTTAMTSSGSAGSYTLKGKVTAFSAIAPTGTVSFVDQTNSDAALGSATLDAATATSGWQTMTPYATAAGAYGIVAGDLNADGIPDIVTSNYRGTSVSVFLGNGNGTYRTHVDYTVSMQPFGMALGDLNGDGIPDLVVAYHSGVSKVSVFLGNGDGTFQAKQDYSTGGVSQYVALGDFNNDGKLDVVALDSNASKVDILLGNGDGTLQVFTGYSVGLFPYGLAVGDFDGDGNLDVAVSNASAATLSVLLGNGNGTLQPQTTYATNPGPTTIVAVDLRNNGMLDLVVGSHYHHHHPVEGSSYSALGDRKNLMASREAHRRDDRRR